ncbi:MAG: enoyl-CoA hydratase/isomerase family protein [Betaproteobacteria bacterium]|nr:enoyl-CoA hydratase/isomerase family protein [Betaproteobacteria bacterium]MBU6511461.1 enoyl-CoA hydratase/isomerase family protein [Betaproteobacteria bacterium]MDE1956868.1 enoyl-CoA hydratase/isomerase family protein [Betaproteobacteria bacterium]MDE2151159.1 enoyl-CoA hydratase/isomerase family protein [Betaproteobacteria bacterium]MDE2479412.1 enoyl-CoA hydratase/isomerase family protein [Betaproteobacteria bacterium]
MPKVHSRLDAGVAVLTLDNPPVNGFGLEQRRLLIEALDAAAADPAVRAIVVTGAGHLFSGGADIREFGKPEMVASPHLLDVLQVAEHSPKPVVAAIHGTCMGGGLEFSLACHGRVALAGALVGLPEVKLGLLPGSGGTQRLPRALGLARALDLIVSGEPVPAGQLREAALFDAVVDEDLLGAACALARRLADAGERPRLRELAVPDAPGAAQELLAARREVARRQYPRQPARLHAIDAVAASLGDFDAGMELERWLFFALLATPESHAMRHAFFAERAAAHLRGVPADTPVRPVSLVGVVGAGTMGGGIAMNFLNAGIPVVLVEARQEALERGLATVRANYENSARRGRLSAQQLEQRMALLRPSLDFEALAPCDLIVEAVFEDLQVKREVFERLDAVAREGAILASNTSTLDLDAIAGFTRRPADVVGMHFFSPANVMKLLEVVRGKATSAEVLATVMRLARGIAKTAVVSGVCDGFIGNRMLEHYGRMAHFLVEEGASPQQVDRALEDWGMAMGPFRMSDLAGNDIGWAIRKRRYVDKPQVRYSRLADRLCELGRFGQKTGAGWYRYEKGSREALPDPEVDALIRQYRHDIGVRARAVSDREIVERCIYALVNEAARILEEGIAQRASDIDMVYLAGYGFPVWRGGPLLWADMQGSYMVARRMREFAAQPGGDAAFWEPAPWLARLAARGARFHDT